MRKFAFLPILLLTILGCSGLRPAPNPAVLIDTCESCHDLTIVAEQVRAAQQPSVIPPHRTVLVLSGGGVNGAYSAGVLCGWTQTGTRPAFDVVTGVSTGALISIFAFLGPEYDAELCRRYTTVRAADVYRMKLVPWVLCTDSVTRNDPLRRQIEEVVTPDVVCRIADAHRQGRRLYIGTTDLESRRPVVWDLGSIAASGQPDSRELMCKILLASASIPGLFPIVEIPVEKDGRKCVERHVDGGMTDPLFFRPPSIADDKRAAPLAASCFASDVYVVVAHKVYPERYPVSPRVPWILGSSVNTFLSAQIRNSLVKVYLQTMLGGMHFHAAAIPSEFAGPKSDIDFDTVAMTKLFEEGRRKILDGTVWHDAPPGTAPQELGERTAPVLGDR